MAHYNITHTCGHTSRPDITGPHKSREYRIKRLEGEACWECRKAADQQAAQQAAEAQALPALTGVSQAQIDYGVVTRARSLSALAGYITQTRGAAWAGPELVRFDALAALVMDQARGKTSARWWLENRDGTSALYRTLVNEVLQARPDLDPRLIDEAVDEE